MLPYSARKAVVLNLKFLNDFDRGLVIDVRVSALALLRRANRAAVERNLRSGVALPVGNEIRSGGVVVVDSRTSCFRDAARQEGQTEDAAVVERDIPHIFVGDVGADGRALGVKRWGGRGDFDGRQHARRFQ